MTLALDNSPVGRALRRAIPTLGLTQMVGWGTTYYLPGVLNGRFETDLNLSDAAVFGAITVMLVISAFLSWPLGRLIDRHGARTMMPIGSLLLASGLLLLSQAQGFWSYVLAWGVMGGGMPLALSTGAYAALAQIAGGRARSAIGLLMLFGGVAIAVFWPLTHWLDGLIGWRYVCMLYAGLHLVICAPLLRLALVSRARAAAAIPDDDPADLDMLLPKEQQGRAALLLVLAFSCAGFVSWGIELHLIQILTGLGLSASAAVGVASMKGAVTLLARLTDFAASQRVTPLQKALVAAGLTTLGLLAGLLFQGQIHGMIAFIVIFSFGTGMMTIARATLPLALLGAIGYATTLGRLALPTQLVFAASPMVFGVVIATFDVHAALLLGLLAATASFLALLALARFAGR